MTEQALLSNPNITELSTVRLEYVELGHQGPPGPPGPMGPIGTFGVVWILDISPAISGIVANKIYRSWIASNPLIGECVSDTSKIRVHVGASGDNQNYSPTVLVNGIEAVLTESSTKRWFTGYADIDLVEGANVITANVVGDDDSVNVFYSVILPVVNSISFGPYPGSQTELKQGDQISVTIVCDATTDHVVIQSSGAVNSTQTLQAVNGIATGVIVVNSASGSQSITVTPHNSIGTAGQSVISPTLTLNQQRPSITLNSLTFESGLNAAVFNEHVLVDVTATNFDQVAYSSPHVTIPSPTVYENVKDVVVTYAGYSEANNYQVTAFRAANASSTTLSIPIKIANTPPTALISIAGNPVKLTSSPTGIDYEVRIVPDQDLLSAPSLDASIGTWIGSWILSGTYWRRNLRIFDTDPRGLASFSNIVLINEANLSGNSITSGSSYEVAGFSFRTLTFPAFSRIVEIGTNVVDQTKIQAQIVGGSYLTRYTDSLEHINGFYISDAAGNYDPNGSFVGLSDSAFAGSNTSGALQLTIQETV